MRTLVIAVVTLGLALAGCGGGEEPEPTNGAAQGTGTLELVGTDGLQFQPEQATVTAGEVTVELTAVPAVQHNVVIEGVNDEEPVVEAAAGETATDTVSLEEGAYTFWCSVPGHREAGMEGSLEVVAG